MQCIYAYIEGDSTIYGYSAIPFRLLGKDGCRVNHTDDMQLCSCIAKIFTIKLYYMHVKLHLYQGKYD